MIYSLLAVLTSFFAVSQSAFIKAASSKVKSNGSMRFNAAKIGSALIFFLIIFNRNLMFHGQTLIFASIYGVALFLSTWFGYLALMNGSMAVTSTIVSYSVVLPCIFGIAFLGEAINGIKIAGFLMLVVSMYLINNKSDDKKFSKQWLFYTGATFLCNGVMSIIQKVHQTIYPMNYCNEFTVYAVFVTFMLFLICTVLKKEEKSAGTAKYSIPAGVFMGSNNYITLTLSAKVNASVLFPMISVFTMIINVITSKIIFKDKFNVKQLIGIFMGVISVLLIK